MATQKAKKERPAQARMPLDEVAEEFRVDHRLKPHKTLRLAVSGDVLVTKLEKEIIDTPEFQRLRRIRQLGTAYHVYPTAVHTRFDHSIGCLSMAQRMLQAIRDNAHSEDNERRFSEDQEILARLYALLHDITHIPFGHTIEDELSLLVRHDENAERIQRFLGEESRIGGIIKSHLDDELYRRLLGIFRWNGEDTAIGDDAFIYDLVSNTVCADLLDYLARDAWFCGLGVSLEYRFLAFLHLKSDSSGLRRIFVRLWKKKKEAIPRRDTLTDLAGLLQARYVVAERVYFHHAKVISGAMLGRAIYEAFLAKQISEEVLCEIGDDDLMSRLAALDGTLPQHFADLLRRRELHKLIDTLTDEDFSGPQGHDHNENVKRLAVARLTDPKSRRDLENLLAAQIGAEFGDVLLYCPPEKMNFKLAKMRVLWKGEDAALMDIDDPIVKPQLETIVSSHKKLWRISVIGSRKLDARQRDMLKEACRIELVYSAEESAARKLAFFERLVERYLVESNLEKLMTAVEFTERRALAASSLAKVALDDRPWRLKLKGAIQAGFGETVAP